MNISLFEQVTCKRFTFSAIADLVQVFFTNVYDFLRVLWWNRTIVCKKKKKQENKFRQEIKWFAFIIAFVTASHN